MGLLADRNNLLGTENAFNIVPHIAHFERQGQEVIKLNLGEPDFNVPEFVKDEITRQLNNNNVHYCDPKGIIELRESIAKHTAEKQGVDVSPERVIVLPGAKSAIGFTQQIYCNPGDEVIYPSPGFPIYESFIKSRKVWC